MAPIVGPMKRPLVAVMLAIAIPVGFLASAATDASGTTSKLSAKLLTISQMPTGWSIYHSSSSGGVGCLANVLKPKGITLTAHATASFSGNGGVPSVDEGLATYSNAKTAYRKIVSRLASCKQFNGTANGITVKNSSIGQMSFPRYGNASEAFATTFTVDGDNLAEDFVVIRDGGIVMGFDEGDLGSVNLSQLEGFIGKAVKKLA